MQRDFELSVQQVYQAVLRPGDTAIDVGAHVGRHAIPMAQAVAPTGTVYAIEPLPKCNHFLKHTIKTEYRNLQDRIQVLDYAIGDYERQTEFIVAVDALAYSGLQPRTYDVPTKLERIKIQVRTLDSLFLNLPALQYIKVDAEGGEYHIFKGAERCLDKFRPLVTFEFGLNTLAEYHITPADMAEIWFSRNYKIYDVNGRQLETREQFIQSAEWQRVWDYISVPAENAPLDTLIQEALREPAMS